MVASNTICPLCGGDRVITLDTSQGMFIACRECVGMVKVTTQPIDQSHAADRIEIMLEPLRKQTQH